MADDAFAVTPDELSRLAAAVGAIHARLDGTRDLAAGVSAALGSHTVASALDHFVSGWRDGRKQIAGEVDELSQMLAQAAQVYTETDSAVASAIPVGS